MRGRFQLHVVGADKFYVKLIGPHRWVLENFARWGGGSWRTLRGGSVGSGDHHRWVLENFAPYQVGTHFWHTFCRVLKKMKKSVPA